MRHVTFERKNVQHPVWLGEHTDWVNSREASGPLDLYDERSCASCVSIPCISPTGKLFHSAISWRTFPRHVNLLSRLAVRWYSVVHTEIHADTNTKCEIVDARRDIGFTSVRNDRIPTK